MNEIYFLSDLMRYLKEQGVSVSTPTLRKYEKEGYIFSPPRSTNPFRQKTRGGKGWREYNWEQMVLIGKQIEPLVKSRRKYVPHVSQAYQDSQKIAQNIEQANVEEVKK
jgi:hypothetical protein